MISLFNPLFMYRSQRGSQWCSIEIFKGAVVMRQTLQWSKSWSYILQRLVRLRVIMPSVGVPRHARGGIDWSTSRTCEIAKLSFCAPESKKNEYWFSKFWRGSGHFWILSLLPIEVLQPAPQSSSFRAPYLLYPLLPKYIWSESKPFSPIPATADTISNMHSACPFPSYFIHHHGSATWV